MTQRGVTDNLPAMPKTERPLTPTVQAHSMPLTPRPSSEKLRSLPRSRSGSHASGKSATSKVSTMRKGEELSQGAILIGMDENDTTTVGRTTTESKRSSSSNTSRHHRSETNDTDHDYSDDNGHDNEKQIETHEPIPSRRSNSSSTAGNRPNLPAVMLADRRRSTSTSSIESNSTSSLRQRTSSVESSSRAKRKHTPRPSDPLETTPTREEEDVDRRHSATEFQKFRDQLHSIPSNPALRTNTEEQLHPNPHHPKTKTEILRIERVYTPVALPSKHTVSDITNYDVLIPRFSPVYPVLLRDFGINEGEWNGFITRVNRSCMEAFDPFRWSNIVVNLIAVLSFWISEWFMPNLTKRVCHSGSI